MFIQAAAKSSPIRGRVIRGRARVMTALRSPVQPVGQTYREKAADVGREALARATDAAWRQAAGLVNLKSRILFAPPPITHGLLAGIQQQKRAIFFVDVALSSKHRDRLTGICARAAQLAALGEEKFDRYKFLQAAGTAIYYLEGRSRKGNPQKEDVLHSVEVAEMLLDTMHECSTTVLCAGMLHDVVEDAGSTGTYHGPYPIAELEADFGEEIAFLVDAKTKMADPTIEAGAALEQIRKRSGRVPTSIQTLLSRYQSKLADHPRMEETINSQIKLLLYTLVDPRVILVADADRGCVLTEPGLTSRSYRKKSTEALQILYPPSYLTGCMLAARKLANEALRIRRPLMYQRLLAVRQTTEEAHDALLKAVETGIRQTAGRSSLGRPRVKILDVRRKFRTPYEMHLIELNRSREAGHFVRINPEQDIMMMQVIVPDEAACSRLLFDVVHNLRIAGLEIHHLDKRIKDFVHDPKLNGYQSMHTTIQVTAADGVTVTLKIQVRTAEMQKVAERGLMANAYRDGKFIPPYLPWFDSPYLWELLDPARSLDDRFAIMSQLTEATKVTLVISGEYAQRTVTVILPPGKTALETAFIAGGNLGMHLANNGHRFGTRLVRAEEVATKPAERKVGTVTLNTQKELRFGDHLAHMQDPVARRHLREWLAKQGAPVRRQYAEAALTEALAQYHLRLSDLTELTEELTALGMPIESLYEQVGRGEKSASALIQQLIEIDKGRVNDESIELLIVQMETAALSQWRSQDPVRQSINRLRTIIESPHVSPDSLQQYSSTVTSLPNMLAIEAALPIGTAIMRKRVFNLMSELESRGTAEHHFRINYHWADAAYTEAEPSLSLPPASDQGKAPDAGEE